MRKMLGLSELAGLPSKKIRSPENAHGFSSSTTEQGNNERLEHSLRDVEFYTRLADAINDFNQAKIKLPVFLHRLFFEYFVGRIDSDTFKNTASKEYELKEPYKTIAIINVAIGTTLASVQQSNGMEFFRSLKEKQPLKYQKAVKEMYKATLLFVVNYLKKLLSIII